MESKMKKNFVYILFVGILGASICSNTCFADDIMETLAATKLADFDSTVKRLIAEQPDKRQEIYNSAFLIAVLKVRERGYKKYFNTADDATKKEAEAFCKDPSNSSSHTIVADFMNMWKGKLYGYKACDMNECKLPQ